MKKGLKGCFLMAGILLLGSGCTGIPPADEAMSKALRDKDVTYRISALDDSSYYLTVESKDLWFDFLMETDSKKEAGRYYLMEITIKEHDPIAFKWIQADAYHNATLKKIENKDCDVMMEDSIGAFQSNKFCSGDSLKEAKTYEKEIRKRLTAYGITPQEAFSYGQRYLQNNKNVALINLDLITRLEKFMPNGS